MFFRSLPGTFLVFERGGVYVPPSTTKNHHPNHKPDPGFPIYIGKQNVHLEVRRRTSSRTSEAFAAKYGDFCRGFKMHKPSLYNKLVGCLKYCGCAPCLLRFYVRDVISKDVKVVHIMAVS